MSYPVAAIIAGTLISAGARIVRKEPVTPALFLGGGIAAIALSVAAGPLPDLVNALSTLIIIAAILGNGYTLAEPLTALFQ